MKILIVDDQPARLRGLVARLDAEGFSDVTLVQNAMAAREAMSQTRFSLLLLDICLPNRPVDEPSDQSSVDLLSDLLQGDMLWRPQRILGLSAYDESAAAVAALFKDYTWGLVRYAADHDGWIDQILNAAAFAREEPGRAEARTYLTDVAILTALRSPEYEAVLRNGWTWEPARPIDNVLFVQRAVFQSGGRTFTAHAAVAPRMGMVSSALIAAKLIEHLRPRLLIMTGICAGVSGKAQLGDVLFADPSWDYQSGKRVKDGNSTAFSIDPHQLDVAASLRSRADQLRSDRTFLRKVRDTWQGDAPGELSLTIGPVASGSAVLADGVSLNEIKRQQQRTIIGLEMEIYGVFAAAHLAPDPQPMPAAFKAVCDFADPDKEDAMQRYAAYTSASVATEFLERYYAEFI
ncbi:response regulator [Methylobacterium pseudosasicola]|uniref:Nucleoside phosphorylase n=1 Tax=Methylobacterium pseudosasicola TaxID=582667 RepID=A0A1I4U7N4_9HYPH|nr:response regulator [Methylobacterium pseudosasicola]SFM84984.1 Nucleoside phosphorylase [Methylobacterium pseudosasicola]